MKSPGRIKWIASGLAGFVYIIVAIGVLSSSNSRFETLVLAGLILIYAAVIYNFSVIGEATDINNHAAFVRFRILAAAQGVLEDENGMFADQEQLLSDNMANNGLRTTIHRVSNGIVSLYALYKVISSVLT